ncbi:MAG: hypothetical protein M0Z54_06415 [Thermaerobacter sp.]|nr:hypothetical protein [Thermaerobacter sp.]
MSPRRTREALQGTEDVVAPPDPQGDPYYAMLLQWLADDAEQGDEVAFEPEQALQARRREGGSA